MSGKNIIFSALVLALLLLVALQVSRRFFHRLAADFYFPFTNGLVAAEGYASQKALLLRGKNSLASEVERLARVNDQLAMENVSLREARDENERLRQVLGLKKRPGYKYIFSEVLTRDPAQWNQRLVINKGVEDNVAPGAVVLCHVPGGKDKGPTLEDFAVVGRVGQMSKHSSVVNLVVSDSCKLSVHLPASGAYGVVDGGGRLFDDVWGQVRYLPRGLKYTGGELVVTSGLSGTTPPSLPVGRLLGDDALVLTDYSKLFLTAKMRPLADLDSLRFLLVLVKDE